MAAEALGPFGLHSADHAPPETVGLHQFGSDHPLRHRLGEGRTVADQEPRAVGPAILPCRAIAHAEVAEQSGEHRLMHPVRVSGLGALAHAELAGDLTQLAEQVLPLTNAQVVQVLAAAQLAKLVVAQLVLLSA